MRPAAPRLYGVHRIDRKPLLRNLKDGSQHAKMKTKPTLRLKKRKIAHHRDQCLEESLQLQKRLRQLTRRMLLVQENERRSISHELQDEIAQTLLAINVRLLNLKTGNKVNLTKEIASMQQLVVESVRSINRFARKLDVPQTPLDVCRERVAK
jgi:signal transduction histidine kinase